jgi:hypothetical protein
VLLGGYGVHGSHVTCPKTGIKTGIGGEYCPRATRSLRYYVWSARKPHDPPTSAATAYAK